MLPSSIPHKNTHAMFEGRSLEAKLVRSAVAMTALFVLLATFGGSRLRAQAVTGSIVGTLTDSTGAAVPGATIVVTDISKGTSQTIQSNESGNYSAYRLIPDTYSVKADAKGFTETATQNVGVNAGSATQLNLVFQVAGSTQSVTVNAGAPALQTDSADVASVISEKQLQDLPNQNRNFTTFALLTPGVQRGSYETAPTENPQGTQSLEVKGSNYGYLGYYLD
jgi:hypothetical protein